MIQKAFYEKELEEQAKITGRFMLEGVPMLLDEASRHARMARDKTKAEKLLRQADFVRELIKEKKRRKRKK